MAPQAVLTYANARGLAEVSRLLMAATGVEFTEITLETREDFLKLIHTGKLIFNQTPLLEIDGLQLVQSNAIARYLARRGSLHGTSPADQTRVDMYYDGGRDFADPFRRVGLVENTLPACEKARDRYLPAFEKLLTSSGTGYLVGSSLTLADIGLLEALLQVEEIFGAEFLAKYPNLKAFYAKVKGEPKIAAYLSGPQRKPPLTPEIVAQVKKIFNL